MPNISFDIFDINVATPILSLHTIRWRPRSRIGRGNPAMFGMPHESDILSLVSCRAGGGNVQIGECPVIGHAY